MATGLIPSALILHVLFPALYLVQCSCHPSRDSLPSALVCLGGSSRLPSLSPAVSRTPRSPPESHHWAGACHCLPRSGGSVPGVTDNCWRRRGQTHRAAWPCAHLSLMLPADWWVGTTPVTQITQEQAWITERWAGSAGQPVMLMWMEEMTDRFINITWRFNLKTYRGLSKN